MRDRLANVTSDREETGGSLFHKLASFVPFLLAVFASVLASQALVRGEMIGAMLSIAFALVMFMMVKWCWSPNRSLRELDG